MGKKGRRNIKKKKQEKEPNSKGEKGGKVK